MVSHNQQKRSNHVGYSCRYRHLLIRGNVLLPGSAKTKVESVELTLMPDVSDAGFEPADKGPPRAVGHLYVRMQMLLADRLKYVVMHGEPIRHRRALIRYH